MNGHKKCNDTGRLENCLSFHKTTETFMQIKLPVISLALKLSSECK